MRSCLWVFSNYVFLARGQCNANTRINTMWPYVELCQNCQISRCLGECKEHPSALCTLESPGAQSLHQKNWVISTCFLLWRDFLLMVVSRLSGAYAMLMSNLSEDCNKYSVSFYIHSLAVSFGMLAIEKASRRFVQVQ